MEIPMSFNGLRGHLRKGHLTTEGFMIHRWRMATLEFRIKTWDLELSSSLESYLLAV